MSSQAAASHGRHDGPPARSGRLARFSGQGISFSYPAGWRIHTHGLIVDTSVGSEIVDLSPQPMHRECKEGRFSSSCRAPFSQLRHDSLLATWSDAASSGWTLKGAPGKRITLDGTAGRWEVRSATNSRLPRNATETISVVAPIPGENRGNYLSLYVELRGPHTAGLVRQVRSMVRSMHWTNSS